MARPRITDKDRGWKKHKRAIKQAARGNPHVLVGVQGPKAVAIHQKSDDFTVVDIATTHEFGLGHMPERSFIRSTHDAKVREYRRGMRKLADHVVMGKMSVAKALGIMGLKVENDIKATMRAGIDPPKKDGDTARLIDTGDLIGSIISVVGGVR